MLSAGRARGNVERAKGRPYGEARTITMVMSSDCDAPAVNARISPWIVSCKTVGGSE